jgi:hypothetical protein
MPLALLMSFCNFEAVKTNISISRGYKVLFVRIRTNGH